MTLDTETTLTAAAQKVAIIGAIVRIMAGQTVHRLVIAWIDRIFTDRMGKAFVLIVTLGTDVIAIFQHRDRIGAMQLMAIGTEIPTNVHMQILLTATKGIGVTIPTNRSDIGRQQIWQVAGVRIVTSNAGISITGNTEMIMHLIKGIEDVIMALQTGIDGHFSPVANLTITLGKRLMTNGAQQDTAIATMWMMTGETIDLTQIHIEVFALQGLIRTVTAEAKSAPSLF